jgi:hypothetical protein
MKLMNLNHIVFQLPVFSLQLFSSFASELEAYVSTAVSPSIANIESVLPGVQAKMDNVHSDIRGQLNLLVTKMDRASARLDNVATLSHLQGLLNHIGHFSVQTGQKPTPTVAWSDDYQEPSNNNVFMGHKTMTFIWNEWHGLQEFLSSYEKCLSSS